MHNKLIIIIMALLFPAVLFGITPLETDTQVSEVLAIGGVGNDFNTYSFEVTDDIFALRIDLSNTLADLDLYIRYGEEMYSYDEADARSAGVEYNESIFLSRFSDFPLKSGTYFLDVAHNNVGYPLKEGQSWNEVPYELSLQGFSLDQPKTLTLDTLTEGVLEGDRGHFQVYQVDIPQGQEYLRIDLIQSMADLDFYFHRNKPALNKSEALYTKQSLLAREFLVLNQETLQEGSYFLTIYDPLMVDMDFPFQVKITTTPESIPDRLPVLLSQAVSDINSAALATVEIASEGSRGSGCMVSAGGYLLTNYHVIQAPWGDPYKEFFISFTEDLAFPPRETFQAVFVDGDPQRDLALLKIQGDFYGNPLPEDYGFPYFTLGDPSSAALGEELHFFGYPGVGGQGSRVSLSYTKGYVSGFEQTSFGRLIKTDGEINTGNSGGSATDGDFRLIGLPTTIVSEHSGHMAYIHPVDLIPPSWWQYWEESP